MGMSAIFHYKKNVIIKNRSTKKKFLCRCMHKTGGSLQFGTEKCVKIIECCFRLHNKALSERVPLQGGNEVIPVFHNHG